MTEKHQDASDKNQGAQRYSFQYPNHIWHTDISPQTLVQVKSRKHAYSHTHQQRKRPQKQGPLFPREAKIETQQKCKEVGQGPQHNVDSNDTELSVGTQPLDYHPRKFYQAI